MHHKQISHMPFFSLLDISHQKFDIGAWWETGNLWNSVFKISGQAAVLMAFVGWRILQQ